MMGRVEMEQDLLAHDMQMMLTSYSRRDACSLSKRVRLFFDNYLVSAQWVKKAA